MVQDRAIVYVICRMVSFPVILSDPGP